MWSTSISEAGLKRHQLQHLSMDYKCTVCNREFAFESELTNQTIHSEVKNFICQYPRCKGKYKTKAKYRRHKTHGPTSDDYRCLECNKAFNKCNYLREHKQVQTGELPFVCSICGDRFKWRSGWKNHVESEHKNKERLSDEF